MKTFKLTLLFILQITFCFAQNFEYVIPPLPNSQYNADINFEGNPYLFDVDNDNDIDVLINGRVYLNENEQYFRNYLTLNIPYANNGYVKPFDADNDGDLDLIVALGGAGFQEHPLKLYENDGQGNFTEIENTPFIGGYFNHIETGDVNNDGLTDVIVSSGYYFNGSVTTILYINNGNHNFSVQESGIININKGYIKLVDLDNDNDLDAIVKGSPNGGGSITKTYKNNGLGLFTQYNSGLINLKESNIETNDIDNDGDLDIVIIGLQITTVLSKVYKNDGNGNFSLFQNLNSVYHPESDGWVNVSNSGAISFGDIDNDGDDDLIIAGKTSWASSIADSFLYINNNGTFTENTQAILDINNFDLASFVDVNNDGLIDVFQSTVHLFSHRTFFNLGNQNFQLQSGSFNNGNIYNPNTYIFDLENDGDQDLLVIASTYEPNQYPLPNYTAFYINNNGQFTESLTNLPTLDIFGLNSKFRVDVADTDNDGDIDIFYWGENDNILFLNDGLGNYTQQIITNINTNNGLSSITKFFDFNNDQLPDLITDRKLFQNIGNNQFSEITNFNVPVTEFLQINDYNNDGFLDIITKKDNDNTAVYYNNGLGVFTITTDDKFTANVGVSNNPADNFVVDINNDGFLDFVFQYGIYINDGTDHLILDPTYTTFFQNNGNYAPVSVADFDNDGDLDIIAKSNFAYHNKIFYNNGDGTFADGLFFGDGTTGTHFAISDFDNDNDLDLFVFSKSNVTGFKQYKNLINTTASDTDGDNIPNALEDINNNNDLTDDDTDGDNIPNYLDTDDDGDNVETSLEITNIGAGRNTHTYIDTDNDLIQNYLDNDDDGDNILTINEDYNNNGNPIDDDINNNGIPDFLDNTVALNTNTEILKQIFIFPNPTKDYINIQTASLQIKKVTVFSKLGQIVLVKKGTNVNKINLENLTYGLYFLKMEDNDGNFAIKKVILE